MTNEQRMTGPRLRLLAVLTVLAVAAACASPETDAQVLGEQVSASAPEQPDAPLVTTSTTTTTAAAPPPTTAPPAAIPATTRDLVVTLSLAATEVAAGEDVRGTLTAENPTDSQIDLTHPSSCAVEQGLYQGGALATEPMMCAAVVTPDHIGPRQTRTWPVRVPTGQLAPGGYEARAAINLASDVAAPPAAVTVTPAS